ncbi:MAG: hypothetical protein ACRCTW_06440, partial [Lactococcus garvieae]
NLSVTCEHEKDDCLPFLDILISRRTDGSVRTSIYRKPTWSGQYLHFGSFSPIQHKISVVKTLFNRALRICSPECVDAEHIIIKNALLANGYPTKFIDKYSIRPKPHTVIPNVEKKAVYLKLPFKGDRPMQVLSLRLQAAAKRTYLAANIKIIQQTQSMLLPALKSKQSMDSTSHIIYKFSCSCGDTYIGRTNRMLKFRISEHIPKWLRSSMSDPCGSYAQSAKQPQSAIAKHLLDTNHVVNPLTAFSVLFKSHEQSILQFIEALMATRHQPRLCIQKKLWVNLKIDWF